jgi:hypothetical protein
MAAVIRFFSGSPQASQGASRAGIQATEAFRELDKSIITISTLQMQKLQSNKRFTPGSLSRQCEVIGAMAKVLQVNSKDWATWPLQKLRSLEHNIDTLNTQLEVASKVNTEYGASPVNQSYQALQQQLTQHKRFVQQLIAMKETKEIEELQATVDWQMAQLEVRFGQPLATLQDQLDALEASDNRRPHLNQQMVGLKEQLNKELDKIDPLCRQITDLQAERYKSELDEEGFDL